MSDNTLIETCDATWNPLGWGCYGPGGTAEKPNRCPYCYAYRLAKRRMRKCELCCQFVPHFHVEALDLPLQWKKPRIIFVESMGDIGGQGVEPKWLWEMFQTMLVADHHAYLILTKQPERLQLLMDPLGAFADGSFADVFSHVWFGVTITGYQDRERLDVLGRMPVAHRFVSYEPMLDAPPQLFPESRGVEPVEWVICGPQTGPGAKLPNAAWATDVLAQCERHSTPLFFKNYLGTPYYPRVYPVGLSGIANRRAGAP